MSNPRPELRSLESLITHEPMARETAATGRLTKKIACHETCSTSSPPRIGPEAMATDDAPAQKPTAWARRSAGNVARRMARVCGSSMAPNSPWTTRKATSWVSDPDSPQARDARANPVVPARKMRLRPKRSPSLPPVISPVATARR